MGEVKTSVEITLPAPNESNKNQPRQPKNKSFKINHEYERH